MTGAAGHWEREPVYGPAEDSALLAATVREAAAPEDLVLDVGTGSGYVAEKVASTGARVLGSDINPVACRRARACGIDAVQADLVAPFRRGVFDIVTFNPPYLPQGTAKLDDWFELAVSGGATGREVIERFLDDLGRVLAPDGVAYLLVSTLTGVQAVIDGARERGFDATTVAEDDYAGETLVVVRLVDITSKHKVE